MSGTPLELPAPGLGLRSPSPVAALRLGRPGDVPQLPGVLAVELRGRRKPRSSGRPVCCHQGGAPNVGRPATLSAPPASPAALAGWASWDGGAAFVPCPPGHSRLAGPCVMVNPSNTGNLPPGLAAGMLGGQLTGRIPEPESEPEPEPAGARGGHGGRRMRQPAAAGAASAAPPPAW